MIHVPPMILHGGADAFKAILDCLRSIASEMEIVRTRQGVAIQSTPGSPTIVYVQEAEPPLPTGNVFAVWIWKTTGSEERVAVALGQPGGAARKWEEFKRGG